MTQSEMEARIVELEAIIHPLKAEQRELEQALAELKAPFKVGDILERKVRWGYAHPPVYRTERVKITSVSPGWGNSPRVRGKLIKKDGTLGQNAKHIFEDDWQKVGDAAITPQS